MSWNWRATLARVTLITANAIGCSWPAAAETQDLAETPVGKTVDDFSLPDFHGRSRSLAEYAEKTVVLVFFGTDCPLAKNYARRLRELAAEFEPRGVAFLGIDANV